MSAGELVVTKKRVPVQVLRVRMSKKDRLRKRWAGKDRFWRLKAIAEFGSWNSPEYTGPQVHG